MLIDAGCLRHPEPLPKLREISPTICSFDGYVELLVEEEQAFRQLKKYTAYQDVRMRSKTWIPTTA